MNILHLIGNGFDINLGLKTRYTDFYKTYGILIEDESDAIVSLKNAINNENDKWTDLELALGEHMGEIEKSNFDTILDDLRKKMVSYLRTQESDLDGKVGDEKEFYKNLVRPEEFLSRPIAKTKIKNFKSSFRNQTWSVNIVSFNYTRTIEKLFSKPDNGTINNHIKPNTLVKLNEIHHVHGTLDNGVILGVNDESQILNEKFHDEIDVRESMIKAECDIAQGFGRYSRFESMIRNAQLICLFGVSLGQTDKRWWQLITNRLLNGNSKLIIFWKTNESFPAEDNHKIQRDRRAIQKKLLDYSELNDAQKKLIHENIFVAVNSEIFGKLAVDMV